MNQPGVRRFAPGGRPWWRVAAMSACLVCGTVAEEPDAVVTAARKALAAGQPMAALQVLADHPAQDGPTPVRLLQARALLTLGRPQEAAQRLGVSTMAQLAAWPERRRGAVAALLGDIALAGGDLTTARRWLEQALHLAGDEVEIDRTAVLLAECGERSDDAVAAGRYAHLVWRDWPRSPYRARAGVIEARLLAKSQPDQARALLAGVRALDQVEPGTRMSAAELLCQLLLPVKPGQCLVVAEQEMLRLPTSGQLPLYRALALAALDPGEGLAALERLDPLLGAQPAARAAMLQLRNSPTDRQQDAALRIERARAEIELGRPRQARAMLEPLAATQPAALILLAGMGEVALDAWLESPAMRDAGARAAVAISYARRGDQSHAWALFEPLVTPEVVTIPGLPQASLLYWSARSVPRTAPERSAPLIARLLSLDEEGIEVGMTWAEEAQRRERAGAPPADVRTAWERSALALPATHPWQPVAILHAARPLMETGEDGERARRLLERVSAMANEDQRRCRFLLAQVDGRLGRTREALQVVAELRQAASPEQAEKLDRLRLEAAAASEVGKGPLDAEN